MRLLENTDAVLHFCPHAVRVTLRHLKMSRSIVIVGIVVWVWDGSRSWCERWRSSSIVVVLRATHPRFVPFDLHGWLIPEEKSERCRVERDSKGSRGRGGNHKRLGGGSRARDVGSLYSSVQVPNKDAPHSNFDMMCPDLRVERK